MISTFTSPFTQKLILHVDKLREEFPKQSYSLELSESSNIWEIKWKSSKYYEESFEIEIWSENNLYTLRGEHVIDDLLKRSTETHFLYEKKSEQELTNLVKEILQKTKNSISELIDLP